MRKNRLEELLDMQSSGASASDLQYEVELYERIDREKRQRGHESEARVALVLGQLDYLTRAVVVSDNETADRVGHDVKTVVDPDKFRSSFEQELTLRGGVVYVQVKSSPKFIIMAQQKMAQRHRVGLAEVDELFYKHTLALIDASAGDDSIRNMFATQLLGMNEYFSSKRR